MTKQYIALAWLRPRLVAGFGCGTGGGSARVQGAAAAAAPPYSWTGLYLGANVGYGVSDIGCASTS